MKRQVVHLSGVVLAVVALPLGKVFTGLAALTVAASLLFLSWWVRNKNKIRSKLPVRVEELEEVEDEAHEFLKSFEREDEIKDRPFYGAIMFMLAIGFTFLVFPQEAAVLAVLILSVSDSASTLIGVHLGEIKLPYNKKKSLEGSSAFLLTAFILASIFTSPVPALVLALAGTFTESLPRLDDNFSVPIAVALVYLVL